LNTGHVIQIILRVVLIWAMAAAFSAFTAGCSFDVDSDGVKFSGGSGGSSGADGGDDGMADESANDGTTYEGTTGEGTTDEGTTGEGTTDGGTTDEGTTDEGTTDEGSTDEGTTDEGTTDAGTTDAGTTGEGACTNEADKAISDDPETFGLVAAFGFACLGNSDEACALTLIMAKTGLGQACATCYAVNIGCITQFCVGPCVADAASQACKDCRCENGCDQAFFTCSGLEGSCE
jgi:hypothetical protein